ncbi:MAG: hypothetical protein AAB575_02400 [Patescibacteria group bacterium]
MYLRKHPGVTEGYKKMILGFVIVTVLLVGVIIYFSASRAVIGIVPKGKTVETDFVADVATDGGGNQAEVFQGVLKEMELVGELEGDATGSQILNGNTIGKVTLFNKRPEAQTLVKTTRLLSKDNVLLRLTNQVVIPANGQIEADVYADNPNSFQEMAPTSFIIPGLWEGIQDKVYAQNKSALKSTGTAVKVVKDVDITRVEEELTNKLYDQAIEQFKKQAPDQNFVTFVVSKKVIEKQVVPAAETVQDKVKVSLKVSVALVAINQNEIVNKAGERLKGVVPTGYDLMNLDVDKFVYTVQAFDEQKKTANVKVHVIGEAVVKADNEIFNKDKIAGLSPKGVELYLSNFEEVEAVSVELSPFWVKKVPGLRDHIEIVVVSPSK